MSRNEGKNFSIIPTILLSLVFGTMVGVLLLLLFGRQTGNVDTVSVVNSGVAGTTAIDRSAQKNGQSGTSAASSSGSSQAGNSDSGSGTAPGGSGSEGTTTTNGTITPAGTTAGSGNGAEATELTLEQTVKPGQFAGTTGAELYTQACQSCHMPGGKGAKGAGNYPALAGNAKLNSAAYVESMVLFGNGGMPGFGHYLSDEQVASIVDYVRTELNKNTDKVTPDQVKQLRPQNPHYIIFGEAAG